MKIKTLLSANAIISIGVGIAFTLYSPLMISLYGILEISDGDAAIYWYTVSFMRLLGASLVGLGFTIWAIRYAIGQDEISTQSKRRITLALLIANFMGFIVALTQQVSIWGTPTGWITLGINLIFVIGYIYFLAT